MSSYFIKFAITRIFSKLSIAWFILSIFSSIVDCILFRLASTSVLLNSVTILVILFSILCRSGLYPTLRIWLRKIVCTWCQSRDVSIFINTFYHSMVILSILYRSLTLYSSAYHFSMLSLIIINCTMLCETIVPYYYSRIIPFYTTRSTGFVY